MPSLRRLVLPTIAAIAAHAGAASAGAQQVTKDAPRPRTPTCAAGVRTYEGWAEVRAPFDSLRLPPGEPIRVTSPEEAQAAQQKIRERAATVGATGLVLVDVTSESGGEVQTRRSVVPVFVPADSARAHKACGR
jgi:hypothetical protein